MPSVFYKFDLRKFEFNRSLSAEHRDRDSDVVVINIYFINNTGKALQRAVDDVDGIADRVCDFDGALFNADRFNLFVGQRNRF